MLITEQLPNGKLSVKSNYSTSYVERFRQLDTARFDKETARWTFDDSDLDDYLSLFEGEIVWKTPLWVIKGEPMPDMRQMYALSRDIEVPESKIQPYDYQQFGIKFMVDKLLNQGFVINADGVGCGKTLQAILTMKYMAENQDISRILVVCKKSIKKQWIKEIQKFTDMNNYFHIQTVEGDKKKREKAYQTFDQYLNGILVINYHLAMNDVEQLKQLGFEMIVVDEAHCVKARTGKLNGALKALGELAQYIVFLTGTPVMSRPDDIFGIVQIADTKYFGKWTPFKKKHIFEERKGRFVRTIGYKALDELRAKVQDILIRRTEHEVSIEMPEMVFRRLDCELDMVQQVISEKIREKRIMMMSDLDALEKLTNPTPEQRGKAEMLDGMLKGLIAAEQANANDPRLFTISASKAMKKDFGGLVPPSYTGSHKTQALCDLVDEIIEADEKVIIFTKFETATRLIKETLESALNQPVLLYTGKVSDEERELVLDRFNEDDNYKILVGTDAMSEGLNLQVARHLIHYDQADTPAIKTQRNGRVRRASSTFGTVFIHDLITEQSKDVERLENIEKAMGLVDGIVSVDAAQSQALRDIV